MASFLYLNLQFIRDYNFYKFINLALFLLQHHLLIYLSPLHYALNSHLAKSLPWVYRGLRTHHQQARYCWKNRLCGNPQLGEWCLLTLTP